MAGRCCLCQNWSLPNKDIFTGGAVYKLSSPYDEDTKSGPGGWGNTASHRAILPVVS